ncbi:putative extracelular cellulose binding protein [Mycena maculata]|uniref:(4-O-methyl)-D-glucuronate--lignin esterase n=1 Tax=Mycena maculata TaxID=230809 RepID=A0AAD7MUY1_9AGAR|nr:putative extracelular cellulose binding protein [Mycena maculata]
MFYPTLQAVLALCLLLPAVRAQCPAIPDLASYNNTALPDLFTFVDGHTKVLTLDDWACRRAEISTLMQINELGTLPDDPPPEALDVSFSEDTLTITVTEGGKSITFAPTITYPTTGTGPFPAIIGMGGVSIPIPSGIAIINFDNEAMANQDSSPASRGVGLFFDLFGSDASAGAMMAWAWAVRRIMDALERTPAAKINLAKVGVSGCSRDGKGALVAGAFEPRLVLTIPQESGSGGTDSWRISDYVLSTGILTQTASEIVQENVWLSTNFDQFANTSTDRLPFDHHSLGAMVAPRGLFVIDNLGYDWLGPFSSYGAMVAARAAYQALGATDSLGISQSPNHTHCEFPDYQQDQLSAFIDKFLFDQPTDTNIDQTAGNYTFVVPNARWAPWRVPKLI